MAGVLTILVYVFGHFLIFYPDFISTNISKHKYKLTSGKRLPGTFETMLASSKVKCCAYCEQTVDCSSVNYVKTSKECQLSNEPREAVSFVAQTDPACSIYTKDDWKMVFRGTAGVGGDIYTGWTSGISVTTDDVTCMTTDVTSCSKQYRDPIIDSWTSIGIRQVKFAFYKNGIEEAFVIFDASGSDITSWFSISRVEFSSWTTLTSDSFNYFSVIGHDPGRRFLINRSYAGCPGDTAYSVVVVQNAFQCNHDMQTSYPQFLYANSSTYGYPSSMTGITLPNLANFLSLLRWLFSTIREISE